MKLCRIFLCLLFAVAVSFAKNYDFFFQENPASKKLVLGKKVQNDIRIRVVEPQISSEKIYGIDLVRPFFILDGIYLSTDGARTLDGLYDETQQFGLCAMLRDLGYTPILVQFEQTVRRSLSENARFFTELLHFINDNPYFGFQNKMEDGIIVLGISQGGILGRYGAYKYDLGRSPTEAPIRLYGSLDSPHQGAVIPKGLLYTIDSWATAGGSAEAEAFSDLIKGPGASELLIINPTMDSKGYEENFSISRFIYGEYRRAMDYKGFPSVLISQGQMKGASNAHANTFYKLNRKAKKLKIVFGRAQSEMNTSINVGSKVSYNRVYQFGSKDEEESKVGAAVYDFVQGSTYPFSKTIYQSLRNGFLDAMPEKMIKSVSLFKGQSLDFELATSWDEDTLIQANSTFIPTTSALDLFCGNGLSISDPCAFTEKYSDISFENPGNRTTGTVVYAVDPTHPRFNEPENGRHIELPVSSSKIDTAVLRGMQVDVWRFVCQVANFDYDNSKKTFRNKNLAGIFTPNASCMDLSMMPDMLKDAGLNNSRKFGYARYDYNDKMSEADDEVVFRIPAGWHKVAMFDYGKSLPPGGTFAVDVSVTNAVSPWMKAELLLHKAKNGASQLQLQEINVPVDGSKVTLRWALDFPEHALANYRWFRLILNSDGGDVVLSNPRVERTSFAVAPPTESVSRIIYPNIGYNLDSWDGSASFGTYSDGLGQGLDVRFGKAGSGAIFNFGSRKNLEGYSAVKVVYWPGTCQGTRGYFDTYKQSVSSLKNGRTEGGFVSKILPLKNVINTEVTPGYYYSASRFVLESDKNDERCVIYSIGLE